MKIRIFTEFLNFGDQIGRKSKCFILIHQGISYQVVDSLRKKISLNLEKNIKEPIILYKHKVIKIKIILISSFSLMLLILVPLEYSFFFFSINSCNLTWGLRVIGTVIIPRNSKVFINIYMIFPKKWVPQSLETVEGIATWYILTNKPKFILVLLQ